MKKITITQVRALFKRGEKFKGFIVGNKVNSFHFFGGWHFVSEVCVDILEEFIKYRNVFEFYFELELGNRVVIYLTK